MGKQKQLINARRHKFLLTFFDPKEEYQVREVNGYYLTKQWNGNTKRWEVAIYTPESWERRKLPIDLVTSRDAPTP
jgi:hypothetical protein